MLPHFLDEAAHPREKSSKALLVGRGGGIIKLRGARGSLAFPPVPGPLPHSAGTHPGHTLTCPQAPPTSTPELLTPPPSRHEGGAPSDVVDGGCDCFQSVGLVDLQAVVAMASTLRLYICKQETVSAFTL